MKVPTSDIKYRGIRTQYETMHVLNERPLLLANPYQGQVKKGNIMMIKPFFIRAEWDDEARVWVATSDDVPGLATEAETVESLIEKLKVMIPELLEANGNPINHEVPFEILTRRFESTARTDI